MTLLVVVEFEEAIGMATAPLWRGNYLTEVARLDAGGGMGGFGLAKLSTVLTKQ